MVKEQHLGLDRRGLKYTLGLPGGEFVWRARTDPKTGAIWKALFNGADVMGSVDVPALSVGADVNAGRDRDEWLHYDQNPVIRWADDMWPHGDKMMYQSMVYMSAGKNDLAAMEGTTYA